MSEKDKSLRIAYINGKFALWKETDFWRMGVMKKMPVLLSLSIVMIFGIFLTIYLR